MMASEKQNIEHYVCTSTWFPKMPIGRTWQKNKIGRKRKQCWVTLENFKQLFEILLKKEEEEFLISVFQTDISGVANKIPYINKA